MRIYYTGVDKAGLMKFGMATSSDGITWTKYNDPATSDALYEESDPVMVATYPDGWEYWGPSQPEIVVTPDGWVMFYRSFDQTARVNFGLAFSEDGIDWVPYPENPILVRADQPNYQNITQTQLQYVDGVYFLFLEIGSRSGTDIFVATHTGALSP